MSNEGFKCNDINKSHGRGLIAPPKTTPSSVHVVRNPKFGLYSNQSVNYSPAQTNQYQMLRPQNGVIAGKAATSEVNVVNSATATAATATDPD
ncbi:hypothetical protein Patl1_06487 [Pistacia atlantica]|uniref:Uncharacterized protein n=1 Tax=Pistacia atlantica TaxID=434234 RepID=A0ACC1BSB7_9ROSI|nr:hypothetical protein Patl1_06487 [Pistacia atlantica]